MQRFSTDIDSPIRGSTYKVCFNFNGLPGSVTYATVTVTHDPLQDGDPLSFTIPRPSSGNVGCVTRTAPSGADAALFEEPNSDDFAVTFS